MTSPNYKKMYSILGVFQDDDWHTVRTAYKRQIRRWHPDRFQDTDQRKIAEDKSKDINLAYQMLDAYFREFGALPPDEIAQHENRPDPEKTDSSSNEHTTQPEHHAYVGSAYSHDASGKSGQPQHRGYTKVILIIVVLAIVYTILEPVITGELKLSESVPSAYSESTLNSDNYASERAESTYSPLAMATDSSSTVMTNATIKSVGVHMDWQNKGTGHTQKSSPVPGRPTFISKGSSKQEVLAIQGRPLRQTDTAWDYGLSRINFRDGRVDNWYENPMNPLNVQR